MSMRRRTTTLAAVIPLLFLLGCLGSIGDKGANGGAGPGRDAPDPTARTGRSSAGVRMLTEPQWRGSVRMVLGEGADVGYDLASPEAEHGFRNVGASHLPTIAIGGHVRAFWSATERATASVFSTTDLEWTGCGGDADVSDPCVDAFIEKVGRRAYRRPLDDEERATSRWVAEQTFMRHAALGPALEAVARAFLVSPNFTYRVELGEGAPDARRYTGYELASRLSYLVWNRGPDDALLDAAATGELETDDGISSQLDRMLESPLAEEGLMALFREYLGFETVASFEGAPVGLAESMQGEAEAMIREVLFTSQADIRRVFDWELSYVDATLAEHYGMTFDVTSEGDGRVAVASVDGRRGFLGTGAFLTGRHGIHRGVAILRRFLCTEIGEPPANFEPPNPADDAPDRPRTQRERFEELTSAPDCVGCHETINDVGFTLETYDMTASYREFDNDLPVVTTGAIFGAEVDGLEDVSRELGASPEVGLCMVRHIHRYAAGDLERPTDYDELETLVAEFAGGDGLTLRAVLRAYVTSPTFRAAGELR